MATFRVPLLLLLAGCAVDPYHLESSGDAGPGEDGGGDAAGSRDGPDGAGGEDGGACVTAPEVCDQVDNDCDGDIDEGFNFAADPANCGGCGIRCSRPGTAGTCVNQVCEFECLPCYHDLDPLAPGCEYPCCPTLGGVEACDGLDNDCDGTADEGFDTSSELANCGGCGRECVAQNATPLCSAGVCTFASCDAGYFDLLPAVNGCEYRCPVFPPTSEACNSLDDDCDGLVDDGNPGGGAPCGTDEGQCVPGATTCVFGSLICTGATGPRPEACDGLDNDCNGVVDEAYPQKGTACADSGVGQCQGTGAYVCNAAQDGVVCAITTPGAVPQTEQCNGLDDDCDGVLDDGAPDAMTHVIGGGMDYWIYTYEASRPDSGPASEGLLAHRPCSRPLALPWRNATWTAASAACAAAGKRLCTEAEWQRGCAGAAGTTYPYGNVYSRTACNGFDYDPDCAPPDDSRALPTGTAYGCPPPALTQCVSDYGAVDLSGNLKEWTSTQVSASPVAYRIRGGGYDSVAAGLTCSFNFLAGVPSYQFGNLGFRCCSDTGP